LPTLPGNCPFCGGPIEVSAFVCNDCGAAAEGRFAPNKLAALDAAQAEFVLTFVRNRGNIKELERELGLSGSIKLASNESPLGPSPKAVAAASAIGYPVVMKIVSPDIIHKSDVGGVKLNLAGAADVRDAYELMMARIHDHHPDARLHGVLIQEMVTEGREIIIGMTRDPQFGPMLMFGLGGIYVEVLRDVSFQLAPITTDEAFQMLVGTRIFKLLKGVRGEKSVDMKLVAECIQRISQLAMDFPMIEEMDINPLKVSAELARAVAVDARVRISELRA